MSNHKLPHLLLRDTGRAEIFTSTRGGRDSSELPDRNPAKHAARLEKNLANAWRAAEARKAQAAKRAEAVGLSLKKGVHLEFVSKPSFDLGLPRMEQRSQKIKLVNVRTRTTENTEEQLATVYVPHGKLRVLEEKIRQYGSEVTEKRQRPRHEAWAAPIDAIRHAALQAFWTDEDETFPAMGNPIWWEVWLLDEEEDLFINFQQKLQEIGVEVGEHSLRFPDRRVLLAHGSVDQLALSIEIVDSIAELRRPREIARFYRALSPREMRAWADDLLERTRFSTGEQASAVCILDTGINHQHPLIVRSLKDRDVLTARSNWGRDDHQGHGTEMAGVCLYGDLADALGNSMPVEVPFVLESVKVLPRQGETDPSLWGWVTQQAVQEIEIERPERRRSYLMAITATATRDRGRPSAWSGAVDQLAAGADDDSRRLIILSAGNESDRERWRRYPTHLKQSEIHDPAQAWNALTVGAFTDRWHIDEEDMTGWEPVAPSGDLAPMTSTSANWQQSWPLKPDIVLEGGNAARDSSGQIDMPDSLSLLTTYFRFNERPFTLTGDTSAASAQAARMAGFLQSRYPIYWPETVRGLLVHSARWTEQMLRSFGPFKNKGDYRSLVRSCGFGVPSLDRALWSAGNRLTLIVQDELQPYTTIKKGEKKGSPQLKEMHFHELPWPREELAELGSTIVRLRVTLSYFIEPSPGERGWQSRYGYASHGLRFAVRGAAESAGDFAKRLNKETRSEGERSPGTGDTSEWDLGPDLRNRGSIHSDTWRRTAAELATREQIAVYPIGGWWKERQHLKRWNRKARYALIVTIEAPEIDVDLYTPVAAQIKVPIEIST